MNWTRAGVVLSVALSVGLGCATPATSQPGTRGPSDPAVDPSSNPSAEPTPLAIPAALEGKVERLDDDSPEAEAAGLLDAVMEPGLGGVREGLVLRLTEDIPVYRLWSGPDLLYGDNTNRFGQWWGFDQLVGAQADYRQDYAVCADWNELTWAVTCTLEAGAVIVTGPGQSVSEETCEHPGESYPASQSWQVYIVRAWARAGEGGVLDCPEAGDYRVNLDEISQAASD